MLHTPIAIIIPSSNAPRVIVESVESILTHATVHWKLAIVDDASWHATLDNYRPIVQPGSHGMV